MRWPLILGSCLCLLACGGKDDYLGAAVTAGAGVAAAGIYRSATDACWADCRPGTECDQVSGKCVPSPCDAECPADYRCVWQEGQQRCVLPNIAAADELRDVEGGRRTGREPTRWLCFVVGKPDCPAPPHREQGEDPPEVDVVTGADPASSAP